MTPRASLSFLRLLCNLRWLAVLGQALTVGLVVGVMHIPLQTPPLWAGIAALALFNSYATARAYRGSAADTASDAEVCLHILVDIAALTWMIAMSGGMENPFASLFLIPIAVAILALPPRLMGLAALTSGAGYFASTLFGRELPPVAGMLGGTFGLHKVGMLANFVVSAVVIVFFFTRMTAAWRRSEREVAQLREQFARNEGIVALATHAASVAHELNTPLGTLMLMVDDRVHEASAAEREEFTTMQSLLQICRDRVRQLAAPAGSDGRSGAPERVNLDHVIQQWQLVRPTIELHRSGSIAGFEKVDPAVGHLLQALLNNAADAGEQAGIARVDLHLSSDVGGLRGEIRDYGVGFDQAQPPLPAALYRTSKSGGLGIGLALSHATVERLGGALSMQATDGRGVRVEFSLPAVMT
jgi:two-component system, sensor histidine kinase RegB